MHLSETELARLLARGAVRLLVEAAPDPPTISEGVFQRAVMRVAREAGWLAYHTYRSTKSAEGFPDLVLAKAGQPLYVVELKREDGQVTPAQQAWLTALAGCTGVISEVWRPSMLSEVVEKLHAVTK